MFTKEQLEFLKSAMQAENTAVPTKQARLWISIMDQIEIQLKVSRDAEVTADKPL